MASRKPASQQVIDAEFRPDPGYVPPNDAGVRDWRTASGYAPRQRGRFMWYGDGPVSDASQLSTTDQIMLKAQLYETIVSLRTAVGIAQARVAATPSTSMATLAYVFAPMIAPFLPDSAPAETKTAVSNALSSMSGLIDMRYNEIPSVMDGTLAPDRWFNACQIVKDGIASILQELGDSDTLALLSQSWQDTKDMFAKLKLPLALGGSVLTIVLLGIAGLVAYAYLTAPLRFMPPKRMAGFSKSKRRTKRKPRRVKAYLL